MEHSAHSESETSRKPQGKYSSLGIILVGLIIFAYGAYHYYSIRILSFTKPPAAVEATQAAPEPVQVTIPSIKVDLPITTGVIKDGVWQVSDTTATFLEGSARPGTGGNVVIYGHNKKVIFGNLPYLSLGQKVFVKTTDGKIYTYIAYQKDFVSPDRVDLVSPTSTEELTIYTCWGLFDSQRVVIKAKPA